MPKTKKKIKLVEVPQYNASIKLLGKVYTSYGTTVKEALENLKPQGVARGTSILTVSKGEVKKERIITSVQSYRLFSPSPLTKQLAIKNVSTLFNI